jgi:hypothetical protein
MSTEPATPPAVSPSPVAPGPAVPPEGHEGHCEGCEVQSPSFPPLGDEELDRIEATASHLAALRAHGTRGRWLYQRKPDADRDVHTLLTDIRGYGFRLGELAGESSDHDACFVTSAHNTDFPADMLRLVAEVRRLKSALIFLAVRFRDHAEAKDGKDSEVAQWLTDLIAREVFDPEVIRKSMEDFAAGRGRELGEIMADLQAARREAGEMRGDREVMS